MSASRKGVRLQFEGSPPRDMELQLSIILRWWPFLAQAVLAVCAFAQGGRAAAIRREKEKDFLVFILISVVLRGPARKT